ncbi:unnamed protein product [Sphagnum jensenii]|uniref:mRNA (guanine-N(7))-methyltransferase n=1 Tax=Sphagnum jensenii TaxID=128206 RepID=A0ABP0WCZ7_9BRYO
MILTHTSGRVKGGLQQRLHSFVKKVLLQQLVPAGAVVCDLFCGRGTETENWAQAEVGKYVGVDLSASALEEARERWEKQGQPFPATFCELDPCMADLESHLKNTGIPADIVCCLSHLQDCFTSEDTVQRLLKNVSSLLKPGGYFFGATPDSSTIWYKYQKAVEGAIKAGSLRVNGTLPRVRTDLYSISFEDDRFHNYGSKYQLRFVDDGLPVQSQLLVHFPSLIRLAEEAGLEYLEIQNLTEFYEDYRVPFADVLKSSCDAKGTPLVDGNNRLSGFAQDVLGLYTTFIFRKTSTPQSLNSMQVPPPKSVAEADVIMSKHSIFACDVETQTLERKGPISKKQHVQASDMAFVNNGQSGSRPSSGSGMEESLAQQDGARCSGNQQSKTTAATTTGRLGRRDGHRREDDLKNVQDTLMQKRTLRSAFTLASSGSDAMHASGEAGVSSMSDHKQMGAPLFNRETEADLPQTGGEQNHHSRASSATQGSEGVAENTQPWSSQGYGNERDGSGASFQPQSSKSRHLRQSDRSLSMERLRVHASKGSHHNDDPGLSASSPPRMDTRETRNASVRGGTYKDHKDPITARGGTNTSMFEGEGSQVSLQSKWETIATPTKKGKYDSKTRNR